MDIVNILFGNRQPISTIQGRRDRRIAREGSPPYPWEPGVTAAGASISIYLDTQFPTSRKYAPLDKCEVVNNDNVDITITINGSDQRIVPSGVIRIIGANEKIGIRHVTMTNDDAAAASVAGAIVLTFTRKPVNVDDLAQDVILRR